MLRPALNAVLRFLLRKVVLKAIAVPVRRRLARFEAATADPKRVQEALLLDILREQSATAFGRDHHFDGVSGVDDFRRQVSVAGYEAIEPYIERVKKGETNALLADPKIFMFALTSGTTATRKFIPVTRRYLADYKQSWNLWGLKVFTDHKELILKPIVQMAGDADEFRTESGVPCGAVTGLTATMQKRIVRKMYAIPPGVSRVKDPHAKYYSVMRLALPRPVGLFVAANPSTMLSLARTEDQYKETLIRDIHDGTLDADLDLPPGVRAEVEARLKPAPERARELEEVVRRTGHLYPRDSWTNPFLMGNWTGGSVGAYLRHYPRYFGDNWVRDPGLIASEGRMTIPFADGTPAGVLDVTSHFFEFIPEEEAGSSRPTVLGAHELAEGRRYFILLTTGYGLYRYHIHDLVRVTGFFHKTPLIEFLSKGSAFANLTGEKLSEYHVTQAMAKAQAELNLALGAFSVAPCMPDDDAEAPYYALFVEQGDVGPAQVKQLAARLDAELSRLNVEYESKRSSDRLGPARVELMPTGFWARWDRQRLERTGGTLEQYKRPALINDLEFARAAKTAPAGCAS
ncbi:MAG: GH3 auxin-responsive promoter family protein [Gemmataceae bacterium]